MTEEFMTWMWINVMPHTTGLSTQDGNSIELLSTGSVNHDSGPDIFNARIRIDGVQWAGNVEMHIKASDWNLHGHQHDPSYDNVILHVVHEDDLEILNSKGKRIPVMLLAGDMVKNYLSKYSMLTNSLDLIACREHIHDIDLLSKNLWIDRMMTERLEVMVQKPNALNANGITLPSEVFFNLLAGNMGFRVNREPFSMLARQIPFNTVNRFAGNRLQTEALFFGQAGLLPGNSADPYVINMIREYDHMSRMFGLSKMQPGAWKFMRMRPNNFPTIRISQFAALAGRIDELVDHILYRNSIVQLDQMFQVSASVYWNDHYTFDVMSAGEPKTIGKLSIENILINTVAVFSFWYGRCRGDDAAIDYSLEILDLCKPEKNRFIRQWNGTGLEIRNAGETQALYHLSTRYCSQKKCLNCAWSTKFLHK